MVHGLYAREKLRLSFWTSGILSETKVRENEFKGDVLVSRADCLKVSSEFSFGCNFYSGKSHGNKTFA